MRYRIIRITRASALYTAIFIMATIWDTLSLKGIQLAADKSEWLMLVIGINTLFFGLCAHMLTNRRYIAPLVAGGVFGAWIVIQ